MNYRFPKIENVQQVYDAIKGREEFFCKADHDYGMLVFNYVVNYEDTFPTVETESDAILRECRGLKFDMKSGKVISRPFHKFFNINEKHETRAEVVNFGNTHYILEKLDGSMITPVYTKGEIHACTKMGVTDVAKPVTEFIHSEKKYLDWVDQILKAGYTPIFEWCSRRQRIIIDYPEDRLVLTAVRKNDTGEYATFAEMRELAGTSVEVVSVVERTVDDVKSFIEETRAIKGAEGFIVRFEDGHMLKVKADEYVLLHKTVDNLRFEKDVIALILDEKLDDMKALLPPGLINPADRFAKDMHTSIQNVADESFRIAQAAHDNLNGSKKRFSLEVVMANPEYENVKGVLFTAFSNLDKGPEFLSEMIKKQIRKNCGSASKVEEIRHFLGGIKWEDYL